MDLIEALELSSEDPYEQSGYAMAVLVSDSATAIVVVSLRFPHGFCYSRLNMDDRWILTPMSAQFFEYDQWHPIRHTDDSACMLQMLDAL